MAKHILSVDDSSSMRQIIKNCLEREGFNISEAEDGLKALEKISDGVQFDFFLVDVNMPNMDGLTFVKELMKNKEHRDKPVIMLTTESQDDKKAEGQKAGATGWITKPFNPTEFVKVIKHLSK